MPLITEDKTNWKFIAIVIVLAFIVGGVVLFCVWKMEMVEEPLIIKKPEILPKEEVEMTGWQIHRSEGREFEIKYPQDYENDLGCLPSVSIDSQDEFLMFIGPISLKIEIIDINFEDYIDQHIKDNEFEDLPFYNKVVLRQKILLSGEWAEKVSWDFMGAHPSFPQDIFLKKANKIYHFQYNKRPYPGSCLLYEDQSPEELASLILSTFRFLE